MTEKTLSENDLLMFERKLYREEKSKATIEKYLRDAKTFFSFVDGQIISKELVIAFKQHLLDAQYAASSINSMLASINSLLGLLGLSECKTKNLRMQKQIYCAEDRELVKEEYMRLLDAAKDQPQLMLVMETICSTGIRVSELRYFTVEAVRRGEITISCKNKIRNIIIPGKLKKILLDYAAKEKIRTGIIFITKGGRPLDRCNIWAQMKRLCDKARVKKSKVFPHNLRKLFARTFYAIEKDIVKLADILGHSSVNTTRIYIMSTGKEHRQKIEKLGLVI